MDKAVVVLTGCQDSITYLKVALQSNYDVYAIHFTYIYQEEKNKKEAFDICDRLTVPITVIPIPSFNPLLSNVDIFVPHTHDYCFDDMDKPGRNALSLTLAHSYASEIGACIVYAVLEESEYSGHPDNQEIFVQTLSAALNIGRDDKITFSLYGV